MITYESRLDSDLNYALIEGSLHFEEKNAVHDTLRRLTARLSSLSIQYAVVGGMAMFAHGFRRFTDDVDLLVTRAGMDAVIEQLDGLGYTQPAGTSTKLRDTVSGVRIEFLITGAYPGDGKPKPVSFPDPSSVSTEIDGVSYLNLATLLELKLASGMTGGVHRMKDLADVVELIKALKLPEDTSTQLNEFVRGKYLELWRAIVSTPDVQE